MERSSWPASGSTRFAISRIIVMASRWLVSKIIWIALDGAFQVADRNQL